MKFKGYLGVTEKLIAQTSHPLAAEFRILEYICAHTFSKSEKNANTKFINFNLRVVVRTKKENLRAVGRMPFNSLSKGQEKEIIGIWKSVKDGPSVSRCPQKKV